ncbi:MAG: AAA family ATPase [Planctomycetes bacterium]|nr:AAA family ATPase [Planctomycetota bacterium]
MSFPPCPQPPDWSIDWSTLDTFPWIRDLQGCPQNPIRHAEGDVWIHVHMVCEAMAALPAFRALPEHERQILFSAALLHDVAKPVCTRVDAEGTVSSRGHSWRGAVKARHILWRRDVPFDDREQVAALVRHHLVPFFLAESENPRRHAIEVSQTARCDWLSILAESDARGRVCPDPDKLLNQISRFREQCADLGCLDRPYAFSSDHSRFVFFQEQARHTDEPVTAEFNCEVVMMSGLPGSGKDFWIRKYFPEREVISLDALRIEMGVAPSDPQGQVLSRAREIARELLKAKRSFIWNASNLSRHIRNECSKLFHEHGAHVRIVYVEASPERLFAQNRQRRRKVPESVIERLLDRWEVPDRTEAHQVDWIL